jgi:Fic family protein
MKDLLLWLKRTDHHPLVASCVFHYELEFIHPFADGNGRMGRLWQTLILNRWNPLFAFLPVETVIHDRQAEYYRVLGACDKVGNSTAFIEFLLAALLTALREVTAADQVSDQVSDQVKSLLKLLKTKPLSAMECMTRLKLSHRPTFRANYLNPALHQGLIERTIPEKPNSRLQKYRLTEKG